MKKIGLYLICNPSWGGTFQYTLSILQTLARLDREGEIQLTVIYEDSTWEDILKSHQIVNYVHCHSNRLVRGGIFKIWRLLGLPVSIWRKITPYFHPNVRAILKANCEVFFFPSQDQMSYFGPFKAITSFHDLMHRYENFPEVNNPREFKLRESHYRNAYLYSSAVLVDSEVGKQHVQECYGSDNLNKIKVLNYIIPYYLEEKKPDFSIIDRLKIPKEYIFYPAQFWKHKNHLRLIEAFIILRKEFPDLGLVLSGGKNNASKEVEAAIQNSKVASSIFITGYVMEEEIIALYMKSRCLVMPTFFGPTNIPPLEALSLGTEVVYSKIYAYEEFLGDSAFFVDPKSSEDIARGVSLVLRGESKKTMYKFKEKNEIFYNTIKNICKK
jgi:glycosyltransferase involved in cell wall biosynthesis